MILKKNKSPEPLGLYPIHRKFLVRSSPGSSRSKYCFNFFETPHSYTHILSSTFVFSKKWWKFGVVSVKWVRKNWFFQVFWGFRDFQMFFIKINCFWKLRVIPTCHPSVSQTISGYHHGGLCVAPHRSKLCVEGTTPSWFSTPRDFKWHPLYG